MSAQFKSKKDNEGLAWSFTVEGSTDTDPAYAAFNHVDGQEIEIVPKDQGGRSKFVTKSDAGSALRMKSITGDNALLEFGVKSGTISNRPAYFTSFGRRHILLDPGASKQVFVADLDEGSNVGDPDAMLDVRSNSASKPAASLRAEPSQLSGNILEIKDKDGNVVFSVDALGNVTANSYT